MRFKEEFLRELSKRLKENSELIESSFSLAHVNFVKSRLYDIQPIEFRLNLLVENDPYVFLNKLVYSIINRQEIKVASTNIACDLLLALVNLIMEEFDLERIGQVGK